MPPPPPPPRSRGLLLPIVGGILVGGLVTLLVLLSDRGAKSDDRLDVDEIPPAMVEIPAGTFVMGNDKGADDEKPAQDSPDRRAEDPDRDEPLG